MSNIKTFIQDETRAKPQDSRHLTSTSSYLAYSCIRVELSISQKCTNHFCNL